MNAAPLIIERTFDAPVAKVWKAITDTRQLQSWYFDIAEFKAEPGFEFVFYGDDGEKTYAHHCRIIEVEKNKKLSYTWKYEDYPEVETIVTFELFPESDQKTRLKLTHEGLDGFPQDKKSFRRESFTAGWTFIIGTSLSDYVQKDFAEYTLDLPASAARVWQIITDKEEIKKWAAAFHPGTYVETTWEKGSVVIWYDGNGGMGAKGVVVEFEPQNKLRLQYYDDMTKEPPAQPDRYAEAYKLIPTKSGTQLLITCGPLPEQYRDMHLSMWEKAKQIIKEMAG